MDEFTQQYLDTVRRGTVERGANLMNRLAQSGADDNMLRYAGSRIQTAQHPTDIDNLIKELGPEFEGIEMTLDPVPAATTIAGGMVGGPTGARGGAALGTAISQLTQGKNPLERGNLIETGLNSLFGNVMTTNPITGAASGTILGKTANMAGQEAMMGGAGVLADKLVDPEQHPWLNLGANLGMFAGASGLARGAGKAFDRMLEGDMQGFIPKVLGSETGQLTLPNLGGAWEGTVGSKLNQIGEALGTKQIPMPKFLERQIGNTGEQFLNTPFDILQKKEGGLKTVGEQLEDTARESERIRQALALTSSKIGEKPLDWLNDFRNVLKAGMDLNKAKPEYRAEMAEILQPSFDALTDARTKLVKAPEQETIILDVVKKQLSKMLASDINDPHFRMAAGAFKGDLTTPEGTKQFLDSIISHPNTPPDTRQIALDLYNLRAKTVQEVSQAYKNGFEKLLISKIIENPEAAVPLSEGANAWMKDMQLGKVTTQLGDFVKAPERYKDLQGMMIHKTVAEGLADLDQTPSAARRFINTYFMNPWKTMKVGLNLPARLRDPISQMIFNDVAGAHPLSPFRIDQYARAAKLIRNNDPIYKAWKHWAGMPGALNDVDIMPMLEAMKHDAGPLDNFLRMIYDAEGFRVPFTQKELSFNPVGYASQYASKIMRTFDTLTKMAKFDWNLQKGMGERAAAVDALKVNGDPMRMSRGVRLVKDYAMPFFGWQSHAMKQMAYGIAHHPVRTAKYFAIPALMSQAAVENLGMTDQEWDTFKQSLPEYVKDEVLGMPTFIPMPTRDEKGRIQMFNLAWWLPGLQDMAELGQRAGSVIGLVQNPAFTMGAALASNKKYSGAPIWFEWEPTSTKLGKAMAFIAEQMTPPMTPGVGNAWQKIYESMGEDPNAMTPGEAFGGQLGYKVQPFEPMQQQEKYQNLLKSWHSEAMTQFNKEMRKHPENYDEQEKIRQKYQKLLTDIESKKLGGNPQ